MTATNHAIAGALIATAVHNPWAAVPLAFVSHFVLDMLPHYGVIAGTDLGKWSYVRIVCSDLALAGVLLIILALSGNSNASLLTVCAATAASPDGLWGYYYYYDIIAKRPKARSKLAKLLGDIQWAEIPKGFWIEIPWGIITGTLLFVRVF